MRKEKANKYVHPEVTIGIFSRYPPPPQLHTPPSARTHSPTSTLYPKARLHKIQPSAFDPPLSNASKSH